MDSARKKSCDAQRQGTSTGKDSIAELTSPTLASSPTLRKGSIPSSSSGRTISAREHYRSQTRPYQARSSSHNPQSLKPAYQGQNSQEFGRHARFNPKAQSSRDHSGHNSIHSNLNRNYGKDKDSGHYLPNTSHGNENRPRDLSNGSNIKNTREWSSEVQGGNLWNYPIAKLLLALCNVHKHLYTRCDPKSLTWSNRSATLLEEIKTLGLDIYCFQELDEKDYHNLFKPTLATLGYTGFYTRRTGPKTDGCALFYKNQKGMIKIAQLRMLLELAHVAIDEQDEDIPIVVCGDINAVPGSTVIDFLTHDEIDATTVPETSMSQFQGRNLPRRSSGSYFNGLQAYHDSFRNIRQELIQAFAIRMPPHKSSSPSSQSSIELVPSPSEVADQMATLTLPTEADKSASLRKLSHPFALTSAYDFVQRNKNGSHYRQWTTYHESAKQMCDFIFCGHLRNSDNVGLDQGRSLSRLEVAATLKLPCKTLDRCTGLPAKYFGSDHLSLATKLRFLKR
ncbi:Protein angel 2 [Podila humilis]|nr:Protein angel 2 [Podila humilis]